MIAIKLQKIFQILLKEKSYDLIIAGRESIDYNGSMVPGMISEILNINFITNCVSLEINGSNATAKREMEGGIETLTVNFH